ncbi:PTS fructose transporter subunit IIA [Aquincola sp. S2]|uniref:PTS fructose transporter subunit IIA n=1 Tax=Pseudaquabacterium terrae TaxID=2732868 RepID=A0ABX2ECJ4_9BURK|nr:PTS fructose transporter subunit IIA [Aquabacterium terrae]NRF66117.1 PTS fructose transporter subunit IIA [Aquabacterium terrae]
MPRLFVIAHAPLASALRSVAAHIFPDQAAAMAICDVSGEQSAEEVEQAALEQLGPSGETEWLILTDVFGATPCNVARRLGERPGTRVLVGVNVPMMWRALGHVQEPLEKLTALAAAGASQGVMQLASARPQNQALKPASHDPDDHHDQQ